MTAPTSPPWKLRRTLGLTQRIDRIEHPEGNLISLRIADPIDLRQGAAIASDPDLGGGRTGGKREGGAERGN